MKILVVGVGGRVSGKEIVTLCLMRGLKQRGHELSCITSTWNDGDFIKRLEDSSISYICLPLGFISKTLSWLPLLMTFDQIIRLPKLWFGYWNYVRKFKPDIIILNNFHFICLLWPLLDPRKTFFHVEDDFLLTRFYRCIFKLLNVKVSAFIGSSCFTGDMLIKLGIPRHKVFPVLNGVEIGINSVAADKKEIDIVRIGIAGQVGEWKGYDDLIDSLSMLKNWGLVFCCLIFGKGEPGYVNSLKKKIIDLDLHNLVHWEGFVKERQVIFQTIDILCVPSRFNEPCGLVALEAACFGIPVVATRRGGLPEIVQDDVTGYLVKANSPEQIAEKLKLLIQNPELRSRMGKAARSYALEHFTQERMVEEIERLFRLVL